MKRKVSASHDEAIVRRLRKDPGFAAQYLKAALEDEDEPRVLLIALRHLAQAQGIATLYRPGVRRRGSRLRQNSRNYTLKNSRAANFPVPLLLITAAGGRAFHVRGTFPF